MSSAANSSFLNNWIFWNKRPTTATENTPLIEEQDTTSNSYFIASNIQDNQTITTSYEDELNRLKIKYSTLFKKVPIYCGFSQTTILKSNLSFQQIAAFIEEYAQLIIKHNPAGGLLEFEVNIDPYVKDHYKLIQIVTQELNNLAQTTNIQAKSQLQNNSSINNSRTTV